MNYKLCRFFFCLVFFIGCFSQSSLAYENQCYNTYSYPTSFWWCNWHEMTAFSPSTYNDVLTTDVTGFTGTYTITIYFVNNAYGVPVTDCNITGNIHSKYYQNWQWDYNNNTYFGDWDACQTQHFKDLRWCHGYADVGDVTVSPYGGGATWAQANTIRSAILYGSYIDVPNIPSMGTVGDGLEYLTLGNCGTH